MKLDRTLLILAVVLGLAGCSASSETATNQKEETEEKTAQVQKAEEEKPARDRKESEKEEKKEEEPAKKPEEDVPADYKNALKQAESYSKLMHMSKAGLYDQLTSEYGGQFPAEAADYALANIKADYNENALKSAKTYSDMMHLSKQGIYDQLTSEYGDQFTPEEAQYAIDHLQADYNPVSYTHLTLPTTSRV